MRITYVLLSPTWGMHQYTADLANRVAGAGHEAGLVTTRGYAADRYAPGVCVATPARTRNSGLGRETLDAGALRRVTAAVLGQRPDVVHVTGPHLWNVPLLWRLRREGVATVHTIHDPDPHRGARLGPLLHVWNGAVLRLAQVVLVHAERYRNRLLGAGLPPQRVAWTWLLHLFLGHAQASRLNGAPGDRPGSADGPLTALFFGRMTVYKGLDTLLAAWQRLQAEGLTGARLVLAGAGDLAAVWPGALPPGVTVREGRVDDADAVALFRECDLLLLPYRGATQSALVAAAYYFGKPVLATRSGALPEYVQEGRTGFLTAPGDATALARTLQRALADRARLRAMGQAGRAWYEAARREEWRGLMGVYGRVACD